MILLLVIIGLLNICLGFGLAMYFGYGPPGLDGILEALGPMPAGRSSQPYGGLGAPYDPFSTAMANSRQKPLAGVSAADSASLTEEQVLGEVRDIAAAAQTAVVGGQIESR